MVIKIHGSPFSTCTKRVLTVCAEKNIPYELVTLNFAIAEHKTPAFLALQPFGKVPVLEDDGLFVFESRAICKYLEVKFAGQGTKLMPDMTDVKAYGLFEQVSCF
jgi:glutathione S-transferase